MDVPRLSKFYREVLKTESDCDDTVHQEIRTNGAALTIYNDGRNRESANHNVVLAFTVDNVDEEYERLLQLHVKITEPPTTSPWGARNMYFEDPDGNTVVFRSFP